MTTFLLVDGHSLAFRAFFGMPATMRDLQGNAVHAVYGFFSVLFSQIKNLNAEYVAVTFDVGRSWRETLYPLYKQGRQEVDPVVEAQVARIREGLLLMGIAVYESDSYEADDIIATLATQVEENSDLNTVILSGDRDLFGCITSRTIVLYPTRTMSDAERYDSERLFARWGIAPHQVADFKALVGDTSDNIPGVKGIGEKGAAKLLAVHGTVATLYEQIHTIEPLRVRNQLIEGQHSAALSLTLATLMRDVPDITFDPDRCRLQYEYEHTAAYWDSLGFQRIRERMPTPIPPSAESDTQ